MKTRANRYGTGKYVEVDVVPLNELVDVDELMVQGRKERGFVTRPSQQSVNDRRTFKYLRMAMQGNFTRGDYYLTLTFDPLHLPVPDDVDVAKKHLGNFLDKCRRRYKKVGLDFKYIWVMEYELDDEDEYLVKVHFHIVMNAGISRDTIEDCWSIGGGKNRKDLGLVTAKRIRDSSDTGLEALAEYFAKGTRTKKSKKIWNSSRNLIRPYKTKNDSKFSQRQLERMAKSTDQGQEILEKKYPGYRITYIKYKYTDYRGWHLYLRMWRNEETRCRPG